MKRFMDYSTGWVVDFEGEVIVAKYENDDDGFVVVENEDGLCFLLDPEDAAKL